MKVFVIYDETGSIYAIRYGENQHIPSELNGLYQEVPEGALVERVDMSDPEESKIVFSLPKENALTQEVKELRAQIAYLTKMLNIEMDETIDE